MSTGSAFSLQYLSYYASAKLKGQISSIESSEGLSQGQKLIAILGLKGFEKYALINTSQQSRYFPLNSIIDHGIKHIDPEERQLVVANLFQCLNRALKPLIKKGQFKNYAETYEIAWVVRDALKTLKPQEREETLALFTAGSPHRYYRRKTSDSDYEHHSLDVLKTLSPSDYYNHILEGTDQIRRHGPSPSDRHTKNTPARRWTGYFVTNALYERDYYHNTNIPLLSDANRIIIYDQLADTTHLHGETAQPEYADMLLRFLIHLPEKAISQRLAALQTTEAAIKLGASLPSPYLEGTVSAIRCMPENYRESFVAGLLDSRVLIGCAATPENSHLCSRIPVKAIETLPAEEQGRYALAMLKAAPFVETLSVHNPRKFISMVMDTVAHFIPAYKSYQDISAKSLLESFERHNQYQGHFRVRHNYIAPYTPPKNFDIPTAAFDHAREQFYGTTTAAQGIGISIDSNNANRKDLNHLLRGLAKVFKKASRNKIPPNPSESYSDRYYNFDPVDWKMIAELTTLAARHVGKGRHTPSLQK